MIYIELKEAHNGIKRSQVKQSLAFFSTLTLVSACSVLSGALRYAWLMSLRGRGIYCRVKLLREEHTGGWSY